MGEGAEGARESQRARSGDGVSGALAGDSCRWGRLRPCRRCEASLVGGIFFLLLRLLPSATFSLPSLCSGRDGRNLISTAGAPLRQVHVRRHHPSASFAPARTTWRGVRERLAPCVARNFRRGWNRFVSTDLWESPEEDRVIYRWIFVCKEARNQKSRIRDLIRELSLVRTRSGSIGHLRI